MAMTFEQAKAYCREHFADILKLERTPNGKKYICPVCGQGAHHNNGLMQGTQSPHHYTCIQCDGLGKGAGGDIFDWACKLKGFSKNSRECYLWVFEQAGLEVQGFNAEQSDTQQNTSKKEKPTAPATTSKSEAQTPASTEQEPPAPQVDYTAFLLEAQKHAGETDYFKSRGLTQKTIEHFKLGFCPAWVHPTVIAQNQKEYPTPRAIIPVSPFCYLARDTRKDIPEWQQKFIKSRVGTVKKLYRENSATSDKRSTIIVTEGELDAISIWQAGGNSLALCSTANKGLLIELIRKHSKKRWVLALDNDTEGQKTSKEIVQALANEKEEKTGYKIEYQLFTVNLYRQFKDANETLQKAPAYLSIMVRDTMRNPAKVAYEQGHSDAYALSEFYAHIQDPERGRCYPTGFTNLDKELGGGLFAGLYTLGAISSLGKTTFLLQVSNNLAKQGYDVLFFSLEMSRNELIAKSISKFSALKALEKTSTTENASTTRQVMSGYQYRKYSDAQRELLFEACAEYQKISRHIYTVEGNFDYTVEDIQKSVQHHIGATGKKPIVFVDYLQILSIDDENPNRTGGRPRNYTDKQKADRIVSTLKRMSRNLDIPVFVVSSFNRESYSQPVSQSSFKESGGIEYSCDVLLGLQYKGMDYDETVDGDPANKGAKRYKRIHKLKEVFKEASAEGRAVPVQCKILKNRNGLKDQSVYFNFFAKYNLYTEAGRDGQVISDYKKLGQDNFEDTEDETAPELEKLKAPAPVIPKCLNNKTE